MIGISALIKEITESPLDDTEKVLAGQGRGPSSELDGGDALLLDSQPPV